MTSTERDIEAGVEHAEAEFEIGDPYWPAQAAVLTGYWELDGGGPTARASPHRRLPDLFSFPQWVDLNRTPAQWRPVFVDYLYLSFTNCTAFSPTDTMPLKPGIKLLMMLQGLTALITLGVVVARAISLLG